MSVSPAVSVIIPAYNHAPFILRTIRSVFDQTFTNFEVIVVNDGSPDRTSELLLPLADAGKIRYFVQQNAGQAAARNRGIEAARGGFLALIDDDDLWPPDKLAWQVSALRNTPGAVLAYGRPLLIGEDDTPLQPDAIARLPFPVPTEEPTGDCLTAFLQRNCILSPGQTLIRRSALDALNEPPFDAALWGVDDYDLWLRLAASGPFVFVPETSLLYRVHRANASKNAARMHLNEMAMYRKHYQRAGKRSEERMLLQTAWTSRRRQLSRYWLATAARSLIRGRPAEIRDALVTLLQLQR